MKKIFIILSILSTFAASAQVDTIIVSLPVATGVTAGTSLWTASGTNIYNNNPGNVQITSGRSLEFLNPTNNQSFKISPSNVASNFAGGVIYPTTGTNTGAAFSVIPRGTGYSSSLKSQIGIYGTDALADPFNYEISVLKATGTEFGIVTGKNGTGTLRPFFIDATGGQSVSTANIFFGINGRVGIGTPSPSSLFSVGSLSQYQVNSTGMVASEGGSGKATLVAGIKTITISGLTSASLGFVQLVVPSGTSSTTNYIAVCSNNAITITAIVAAGTINTSDVSTLNYRVITN